jgi:nitroreductase
MHTPTTPAHLLARLQWRYSTKRFDRSREIPAETWAALEQALVLSPSSFGLQPWKFVVVDDPALRQELRERSWDQAQITDASKLVVFLGLRTMTAADVDRLMHRQSAVRGTTIESLAGYRKVLVDFIESGWAANDLASWNARQVYLALGQFMTASALLGIDTCALEGIDLAAYDQLLGLQGSRHTTLLACAAGYRADGDKYANAPKVRYAPADIIERRPPAR